MANSYDIPSWAGKPPTGLHLDVLKDDKLVQKLMVDEKKCYLFGRNNQMNDFCIDHASCSRVHASFVYHKHLNIAYLVDLGSTHGTYIGNLRLEAHKPTQLPINSTFHFGASTRRYILRERPLAGQRNNIMEDLPLNETSDGALLGLPETQTELDNLTEYNTAHNRRISMLGIADDNLRKNSKSSRRKRNVTFNDEEIIINPEDVDPNVGRFRNLIQTTVIPIKRAKFGSHHMGIPTNTTSTTSSSLTTQTVQQIFQRSLNDIKASNALSSNSSSNSTTSSSLYQGLPEAHTVTSIKTHNDYDITPIAMGTKLGLFLPNPAPEVSFESEAEKPSSSVVSPIAQKLAIANANVRFDSEHGPLDNSSEPQKKKYAKEAWPGRKPMLGQL